MRVIVISLLLILPLFSKEYTLEMLLDQAYRNSDAMAVAQLKMTNSALVISEAKRKMLPTALLSAEYDHSLGGDDITNNSLTHDYMMKSPVPQGQYYAGDTIITNLVDEKLGYYIPQRNNLTMGVDVRQTIWQQNKIRHSIDALKIANRSAVCEWQDAQMQVKATITRLFYGALLAKQKIQIEEESSERNKRSHALIVDYYSANLRSELDTLNSYIDLVSNSIKVSEAQREYRESRQFILAFANIELLADSLELLGELLPESYNKEYDEIYKHFLQENKVLTVLTARYDQSKIKVKIDKGDYLPIIYGGVSFERTARFHNGNDFSLDPYRKLYLGLTYNLFEGGQRSVRIKQSEHRSQMDFHELQETRRRLTVELKSLFDKKQEYEIKMDESKNLLEASQKGYEIAYDSFKAGLIKQIELDDSNDRLLRAELFYAQSIYNYNSRVIDLRIYAADYLFTN